MTSDTPSKCIGDLLPCAIAAFLSSSLDNRCPRLATRCVALALPWTVIAVTGDPIQVAVAPAAEAIPRVLCRQWAAYSRIASIDDRDAAFRYGRAGVVGVLGVTLLSGLPPLWVVVLLAA